MLILARNQGQSIEIQIDGLEPIKVEIVDIDSNKGKVQLGITAERSVTVHRSEVADRIRSAEFRRG